MDFYDNLTRILEEKGMSRRQLAIKAGVSPATLNSAFARRGKRIPADMLNKLAIALDVEPEYLFDINSRRSTIESFNKKAHGVLSAEIGEAAAEPLRPRRDYKPDFFSIIELMTGDGVETFPIVRTMNFADVADFLRGLEDLMQKYGVPFSELAKLASFYARLEAADHAAQENP